MPGSEGTFDFPGVSDERNSNGVIFRFTPEHSQMLDDLSVGKVLLILFFVLIFFGPKKIPDIAQSIGKGIKEFKKAMSDVSAEIKKPMNEEPASRSGSAEAVHSSASGSPKADSKSDSELN